MLAQIRLAWWRDEFAKPPEMRPGGDAVLDAIGAHWGGYEASLSTLVDAWEMLLIEPPMPEQVASDFVEQRSQPFADLARIVGAADAKAAWQAGRVWAAMDASIHASEAQERALFSDLASANLPPSLPRSLRGITVLAGLAWRAAKRAEPTLMAGRSGAIAALRLGIFGR